MDRAADLRADYDALAEKLREAEGSAAAAIVRERRLLGELLERLDVPEEVPLVDKLADNVTRLGPRRRGASTKAAGAPTRGRKSG